METDPFDRNWLEVRILIHLNHFNHPITLEEMKGTLVPGSQEATVAMTFRLEDAGLLVMREIGGGKFIEITPQGRNVLSAILSGRSSCD